MKYLCTECNKFVSDDEIKTICKPHRHQTVSVLDESEVTNQTIKTNTIENISEDVMSFAHSPNILEEWKKDLDAVHVGDVKNKILAGILLVSSKRQGHEQALIIQKLSSAGGSNLQNSLLRYFDNKITLTRMTPAYLDRSKMSYERMILAIGEMSGFDSASSSLRQKLSEGKTELATTDKDEKGRIITDILRTEGRPSLITTTTSQDIHPEFENRCWILGIDETQNQTRAVNKYQFSKDMFEYEEWKPSQNIKGLFNSGILEDLRVVNPFSVVLGENFPCDNVTARRDSKRFADLITTITFIYQHQRIKIKTRNQTIILSAFEDLKQALYYGQDALKNTLNKLNEKSESVIEYMKSNKDMESFTRIDLCKALDIPYETMKRILNKLVGRSFIEEVEVDRVWKYKLSNKAIVNGISLGLEDDFQRTAIEYLTKHAPNFEQVILPTNYKNMIGIDKIIVDYLLSLNGVVTAQNGDSSGVEVVPVTTLPLVRVTGMEDTRNSMTVTTENNEVQS